MSKRHKTPIVNLADFKAKKAEEGSIPIDLGDGDVIRTRSPFILTDDEMKALAKAGAEEDMAAMGQILLGEEGYARFLDAGGTGTLLAAILEDHGGDDQPGESGASSDS